MAFDYDVQDDPELSEEELEMFVEVFSKHPKIIQKLMERCV
jgi:hypothetical protein